MNSEFVGPTMQKRKIHGGYGYPCMDKAAILQPPTTRPYQCINTNGWIRVLSVPMGKWWYYKYPWMDKGISVTRH
jgi:hypothetical protein